jgi:hypothetical protein
MTGNPSRAVAITLLCVACAACASSGGQSVARNRDILTRQELQPYDSQDAYTVIGRLRRSWLNVRSTGSVVNPQNLGSESQIQVYVDGVRTARGVEDLRSIDVGQIREIRYLDARDATMAYGTDHGAGAILVTTG